MGWYLGEEGKKGKVWGTMEWDLKLWGELDEGLGVVAMEGLL